MREFRRIYFRAKTDGRLVPFPLFLGSFLLAVFCAGTAPAAGVGEGKLTLSLPEVVIESPDIERLVAQRVRPVPPKQLGVQIPRVLPRVEIPEISPPSRPVPKEREPDMDLTKYLGGLSRIFGDPKRYFESGLAFLKKGEPVEALLYFNKARESKGSSWAKAAGQFWASEVLIRLGKLREAHRVRRELLKFPSRSGSRYIAAARYALADESCRAKKYQACLKWLDEGVWSEGGFASEEARFLHAWALLRLGIRNRGMEILLWLTPQGRPLSLKALVAMGHLYLESGDFARAESVYLEAESSGRPKSDGDRQLLGEALHGIGWARLHLGKTEEARRAFSLALQRHPGHLLRPSIEAGILAVILETRDKKAEREFQAFMRKYPESPHIGPLQLQLAWMKFRQGNYARAGKLAASVSDRYPLGQIYRLGRVIEGLSLYHQGRVKKAFGVLRAGADRPPSRKAGQSAERSAARSAAMATAFAAFRLKDFSGARKVLEHWAFPKGPGRETRSGDAEAALWYGEAAFEEGDLKRAQHAFEKILKDSKVGYRAKAGLAWIFYRKKNWKQAALAFDQVFSMNPSGPLAPEALARAGEARFNQGNYSGALETFARVERKFVGGLVARKALLEKGKLLFRRERYREAERAFVRFLDKYPASEDSVQVDFWKALIPFRRGQFKDARTRLFAFAERNPKSALAGVAYLRIGDAFYNDGEYLQADRIYRLMKNRFPKHSQVREATYGLILTRLHRKNYKQFIDDARHYIERYRNDDLSIALGFQIGEVLLARGDLDGALQAYREVETRYANQDLAAHALLRIGNIHRRKKEIDASLDAFESLAVRYPKSPLRSDALFGSGETLAEVGRCNEATGRLKEFLKKYPGHDYTQLAHYELGRCAARQGNSKIAIFYLKKTIGSKNTGSIGLRANASLLMASLLTKQGKMGEASKALKVALLSDDPAILVEALFSRADILARQKDPRAASEFLKLTYQFPKQKMWVIRAYERAGSLYEIAGRRSTALRIFQKLRQVAPKGPMRIKAEKAVKRLSKEINLRQ